MLTTFRDTIREASPWWLKGWFGQRLLYAFGIVLDAAGDAARDAVYARFPQASDPGALQAIGRERRLQRGRLEPASTYAARLPGWLDAHRQRGGPYGMLEQFRAFWLGTLAADLVYFTGRRFQLPVGSGAVTWGDVTWAPDSVADWARWWLFVSWSGTLNSDGLWNSGGVWEDGGIWDYDIASINAVQADDLRLVPREWNAAHAKGLIVLFAAGAELWDYPAGLWSDAGTWGADSGGSVVLDPMA